MRRNKSPSFKCKKEQGGRKRGFSPGWGWRVAEAHRRLPYPFQPTCVLSHRAVLGDNAERVPIEKTLLIGQHIWVAELSQKLGFFERCALLFRKWQPLDAVLLAVLFVRGPENLPKLALSAGWGVQPNLTQSKLKHWPCLEGGSCNQI